MLGALLVNPQLADLLPPALTSEAFYRDAHRRIFAAFSGLRTRGVAIDMVTMREELTRTGDLEEVGGPAYLAQILDGVPMSSNANHYANIVTEHATRRAVVRLANTLLGRAYEAEETPQDLLAYAQRELTVVTSGEVVGGAVAARDLITVTFAALERSHGGQGLTLGVRTGFTELDEALCGLQRGNLILVAARTSMGKTSLAMNIADYVASGGHPTLVFSLEMTKEELMARLVASKARIDSHRIRGGFLNEHDYRRISHALGDLAESKLVIDDTPGLPVSDLRQRCLRAVSLYGALDLVVVDYLQLLTTRDRHENRQQQVAAISKALKVLAKELDVPVVALSQLSRAPDARSDKRPQLSDLRESGSLEQDADVVLFIYRDERRSAEEEGVAEIIIGKQRNGPCVTVRLCFMKEYTRFENLAATLPPQ